MVKWTSGDVFKVPAGETVAASACVPINSMAKVENLNALSYCHFTAIANSRVKGKWAFHRELVQAIHYIVFYRCWSGY